MDLAHSGNAVSLSQELMNRFGHGLRIPLLVALRGWKPTDPRHPGNRLVQRRTPSSRSSPCSLAPGTPPSAILPHGRNRPEVRLRQNTDQFHGWRYKDLRLNVPVVLEGENAVLGKAQGRFSWVLDSDRSRRWSL